MSIVQTNDKEFASETSNGLVLVDFWATWCGPCKMMNPVLEEVSNEMESTLKVVKVDVDQNQETSGQYGIMSIPTMLLMKDGEIKEKMVGFTPKEKLSEIIKKHQ